MNNFRIMNYNLEILDDEYINKEITENNNRELFEKVIHLCDCMIDYNNSVQKFCDNTQKYCNAVNKCIKAQNECNNSYIKTLEKIRNIF